MATQVATHVSRFAGLVIALVLSLAKGSAWAAPAPPRASDVVFSFNRQSEGDRRTPARLEAPAGERLVLKLWITMAAGVSVADPDPGYVSVEVRDAKSGRSLFAQRLGPPPRPRPYTMYASGGGGGGRNFLVVALPWCHPVPAGTYAMTLHYASPGVGPALALERTATTELVVKPAPARERRHFSVEVVDVGVSEDHTRAMGQLIAHNDGCEAAELATIPPGRLEVVVRDGKGRVVCQPDAALKLGGPSEKGSPAPGEGVGLGVGAARCDADAVRAAGPIESLRGHVRYDSSGLPGWHFVVDADAKVVLKLEPRPGGGIPQPRP